MWEKYIKFQSAKSIMAELTDEFMDIIKYPFQIYSEILGVLARLMGST